MNKSANTSPLRIAIAQINLHVGAIENNTQRIIEIIKQQESKGDVDIVVFPELSLTSYPPEDLLLRAALYNKIAIALDQITAQVNSMAVIIGYPVKQDKQIYNACSLIHNGQIIKTYFKQQLPNYGVFDEKRYFEAGTDSMVFTLNDVSIGFSICEDIWYQGPGETVKAMGADLILNINASPFHRHKQQQRKTMLSERARNTDVAIVYVNLVGGQDELVFDGRSMAIDANGEIAFEAPAFSDDIFYINYYDKSQRFQHDYPIPGEDDENALIYNALVMGVRDYVIKNGFNGALIGLSGGIDSALCLCIAVDALGAKNVEVVSMPSTYTLDMSNEDAVKQAENLGVNHHSIPIEKPFNAFTECLSPLFSQLPSDLTEENIQARCRGILLMAMSNKFGKMVLTTGNKSEMAVGYATLYGDMCGGFAPLKDVSKLKVYELARWRNRDQEVIPARVIERPPSAELRPDQKDEDSLPAYSVLDPILERYIEQDISPEQIIAEGYQEEDVRHVVRLVDINEYKRRQAAPGVRITQRAFGRDRRYPITSGYQED